MLAWHERPTMRLHLMPDTLRACLTVLLLPALWSCQQHNAPLELKASSSQNKYVLRMQPQAPLQINRMHAWNLQLSDSQGQPIDQARITISGGMPSHNHGLPTQPQVSSASGHGQYLLEGMRFSMSGWWEIKVQVDASRGRDTIIFNTIIPDAGSTAGSTGAGQ
ncbi:MAG: hypothetical protein RL748_4272 [Pseudomonadota bacterium]